LVGSGLYFACDRRVRSGWKFGGPVRENGPVDIYAITDVRYCQCRVVALRVCLDITASEIIVYRTLACRFTGVLETLRYQLYHCSRPHSSYQMPCSQCYHMVPAVFHVFSAKYFCIVY